MLITHDLREREFLGKIVPKGVKDFYDPKLQGRYKVHIPDLMPHIPSHIGIWCKNQVHKWRMTPSDVGEYGQYFPLQAGTFVMVKFFENDMNTGFIDRIISDYDEGNDWESQDNTTTKPALTDRDEEYVIFKTPKKWDIMYVTEDTENEQNTIYLIYNRDNNPERRTVLRIDETGIHWWTRDNQRVRIKLDDNKQVDGNQTEYVKGYRTKHVIGRDDLKVLNEQYLHVDLDRHKTIQMNEYNLTGLSKHYTTGMSETELVGISKNKTIGLSETEMVGLNKSELVGINYSETVGIKKSVMAGMNIHEVAGLDISLTSNIINLVGTIAVNISAPIVNINGGAAPAVPVPSLPAMPPTAPLIVKPETHVRDLGWGKAGGETPEYQEPDIVRMGRPLVKPSLAERPTDLGETQSYVEPKPEGCAGGGWGGASTGTGEPGNETSPAAAAPGWGGGGGGCSGQESPAQQGQQDQNAAADASSPTSETPSPSCSTSPGWGGGGGSCGGGSSARSSSSPSSSSSSPTGTADTPEELKKLMKDPDYKASDTSGQNFTLVKGPGGEDPKGNTIVSKTVDANSGKTTIVRADCSTEQRDYNGGYEYTLDQENNGGFRRPNVVSANYDPANGYTIVTRSNGQVERWDKKWTVSSLNSCGGG